MSSKLIRLGLGYITHNEESTLSLSLPKLAPYFDTIVAVDAESTDATCALLASYQSAIVSRPWDNHYGNARTACISEAEKLDLTHLLMLDADEAMLAADLVNIRYTIADLPPLISIAFPRYEFVDDFYHFNPGFYPDFQCRCFPLGTGYHYRGHLHEQLWFGADPKNAFAMDRTIVAPNYHIFHYGKCRDPYRLWLKYANYDRTVKGQALYSEVPPDAKIPESFSQGHRLTFHGERPL